MPAPAHDGGLGGIIIRIIVDRHMNRLIGRNITVVFFFQGEGVIFGMPGHKELSAIGCAEDINARFL